MASYYYSRMMVNFLKQGCVLVIAFYFNLVTLKNVPKIKKNYVRLTLRIIDC